MCSLELCEPQLDTEAEIMAYFDKNQTGNARQPHGTLSKYSTSSSLFSLMFKFPLQLKVAVVSLLYVILSGVLLMIFIYYFVPTVCRIQQFSRKHQEQKTEQESPLITSRGTLVGKPGQKLPPAQIACPTFPILSLPERLHGLSGSTLQWEL